MYLLYSAIALTAGTVLDWIVGDPRGLWHPVIGIGKLIDVCEGFLRSRFPRTAEGERRAGVWLTVLVIAGTLLPAGAVLLLAYRIHPFLGTAVETVFCCQLLAARSLQRESAAVAKALGESLDSGRHAVSMIVGRDTEKLTEEGVVKAAVETVAENTSDGVIAPMFYMALGGGAAGFFYKACNTMDSMVGYKNDRYLNFGRAAALLDDAVNYIPARLSAVLMILGAGITGFDMAGALRIWRRDRRKHASPNSAQTEAVMAGALGVELAGDAWYFGKLHKKPVIGDPVRRVERADIGRSHRLMYAAEILGLLLMAGLRFLAAYLMMRG